MATTITLASTNNAALASSTLTLSAQGIGTASQDRIVAVVALGAGTVTSMTIGGFTAKSVVTSTRTSSPFGSIWTALVSAGTTANIVVNSSVAAAEMGFGIYAITTADTASSSTHLTAATAAADFLTTGALTITASAAGLAGFANLTSSTGTITWTNATLSFQTTAGSSILKYSVAKVSTSANGLTISASNALSLASVLVVATWGSTVPQTAVGQDVTEALTAPAHRTPDKMIGY